MTIESETTEFAEFNRFADKDGPLREDIRFLGHVLGDTIRAQEGEAFFHTVEQIRTTSIRFHRDRDEKEAKALERILAALTPRQAALVVRSFSYFSHLANIAEMPITRGGPGRTRSPGPNRARARSNARWPTPDPAGSPARTCNPSSRALSSARS